MYFLTELASKSNNNNNTSSAIPNHVCGTKSWMENNKFATHKKLLNLGTSSLLVSNPAVQHLKKVDSTGTLFNTVAGEFYTNQNITS